MKEMTMRKLMFAASLLAACGNVEDQSPEDSCMTAADCEGGKACDLVSHVCVEGALTLDPAGFALDGPRWWTLTSGPTLKGTFQGAASSTIDVALDGNVTPATLEGNTWTATLPVDSITSDEKAVTIKLVDPSGSMVELSQVFVLDTLAPAITLAPSRVHDERGDAVEFSTGEPVHTHDGPETDLAESGCPSIYKYAYLMTEHPTFGRQASQNALAWNYSIQDAKVVDAAYRVRNSNNEVLLDWTAMTASGTSYPITLDRDRLSALGTYEGQLFIDVRAKDWAGFETSTSACVDYHPLAAPLEIAQIAPASDGVLSWSLPANSPISRVLEASSAPLAVQRVVQYTAEPIIIEPSIASVSATYSKTVVNGYVPSGTVAGGCGDCGDPVPPPATVTDSSGALIQGASYYVYLVDESTGQYLLGLGGKTTIPPREANAAPHAYLLVTAVGQLMDLRPASWSTFGEYTVDGHTYTGTTPGTAVSICIDSYTRCVMGECFQICRTSQLYTPINALDKARVDFSELTIDVRTAPTMTATAAAPPYVAPGTFTLPPLTWDMGDDDLPGPN